MPAGSPQARDIVERVAADSANVIAAMTGKRDPDIERSRRAIAEYQRNGGSGQWLAQATGLKLLTRYHVLVARINGAPMPELDPGQPAAMRAWMAAALR